MKSALAVALLVGLAIKAQGEPVMYIHDLDRRLARVDVATGDIVQVIGTFNVFMADIAFDPQGNLFGVSFTSLYSIDPQTAQTTFIGNHGLTQANALVFGQDGTLYAAEADTDALLTIDPTTGQGTRIGNMGFASGGDLAFFDGRLLLASRSNNLVEVDLANPSNSRAIGAFGVPDVFGLATGDDNVLYGVANTNVFQVNPDTGQVSGFRSYGITGQLGIAAGQAFFSEASTIPEPTCTLACAAFAAIICLRRRQKSG